MSATKQAMEEAEEHAALKECLEYMIQRGMLNHDAAEGVAKLVIDKGVVVLSKKQRQVYGRYIAVHLRKVCPMCGCVVPPSEWIDLLDDESCSECRHRNEYD